MNTRTHDLSARLPAVLLVLVLLLGGACTEDDGGVVAGDGASSETDAGDAGDRASGEGGGDAGGGSAASGDDPVVAGDDYGAGGGAGAGGEGGATGSGGGTAGSGGDGGGGGGGGAPAQATPTRAGTYRYDAEGQASFGAQQQEVPDATLEVDAPQGNRQRQVVTADGGGGRQEILFEFRADGLYIVEIVTTNGPVTKRFSFAQPVLAFPVDAPQGRSWSWSGTSDDGKTNLESTFTVGGREQLAIGGQAVDTVVLDTVVKTSGDIESTSTGKRWVSPEHRLTVKETDHTEGSYSGFPFTSDSQRTLVSLTPQ